MGHRTQEELWDGSIHQRARRVRSHGTGKKKDTQGEMTS